MALEMHHSPRHLHGHSSSVVMTKQHMHADKPLQYTVYMYYMHWESLYTFILSDVADFSSLTSWLHPQEAVRIIDHLHALIDETFTHPDIFLMERTSSGCIAASGLVEAYPAWAMSSGAKSQLSMTDSSYGSVLDLDLDEAKQVESRKTPRPSSRNTFPVSTSQCGEAELQNHLNILLVS